MRHVILLLAQAALHEEDTLAGSSHRTYSKGAVQWQKAALNRSCSFFKSLADVGIAGISNCMECSGRDSSL